MNCPRCKDQPLSQVKHPATGIMLDVCHHCRGIWFDAGKIEQLMDVAVKHLEPPKQDEQRPTGLCPKCTTPMRAFFYPQTAVTIDMCPDCRGIWLDNNEFEQIRKIRRQLQVQNVLQLQTPVPGVKGALLRFIDQALAGLIHIH
jgi:Zn-finger nucleic acid-binding protein